MGGGRHLQASCVTSRPVGEPSSGVKLTRRHPPTEDTPVNAIYLMQHRVSDRTASWHEDESPVPDPRVTALQSRFAFLSTTVMSTNRPQLGVACPSAITSAQSWRAPTSSRSPLTYTATRPSRSCHWVPDSKKPRVRLATRPGFSEECGGLRVGAQVPPDVERDEVVTRRFVLGDTAPLRSTYVSVPDSGSGIALIDGQRVSSHTLRRVV